MDTKISVAIISVLVASMVLVAGLPLISGIMGDTVTATNEGAGDLRFNLVDSHVAYTVSIAQNLDDTGIEITNGSDVQTLLYDDASIIYADDNIAIWYDLNDLKVICPIDGAYVSANINDDVQVSRTASGVEVSIGDPAEVLTFPAPTWAYVANSTGKYGYFENGTEITVPTGTPLATVGSYAGVDCYNSHNNYDLPLALDLTQTDNVLSGAKWISAIVEDEQDAKAVKEIVLKDDDEKEIIQKDPENDSLVKGVPTPTYTDGDWGYNYNGLYATIVSYSGAGGNIVVPATVGGYPVKYVGIGNNYANQNVIDNNSISPNSTLTLSEGIQYVNAKAFTNTTNIVSLTLPNSLIKIGDNLNYVNGAFNGCTGLTSVTFGNSLETIGANTFSGCTGLTELVLPDSVKNVYWYAFKGCTGLTSVTFGNSFKYLGVGAFEGCTGLTGALVLPDSLTTIEGPSNSHANDGAFANCTGITSVTFGNSLEIIPPYAFFNCTGLTELVLPDNIKEISGSNQATITGAFEGCTGLTSVTFGNSLDTIGSRTFRDCTGLTGVLIIPSSVVDLSATYSGNSYGQFSKTNYTSIVIAGSPVIGDNTFSQTLNLSKVLNLGETVLSPGSNGLSAIVEISDNVPAMGYLSAVEYTEGSTHTGPTYDLIAILPLVLSAGLVLFCIAVLIRRV